MTLLRTLLDASILGGDAQVLAQTYGNVDPGAFLDGLEQVSRILVTKETPGLLLPSTEPWKTIYESFQCTSDFDQAYQDYIAALTDISLQGAIIGAVTTRMNGLRQWFSQQAQTGRKRKTKQYIQALGKLGYQFKYNMARQEVEVNGERINDQIAQQIRTKLRDIGIWETNVAEDAYGAEAYSNRYHPVQNYLLDLKFEGGDPIGELSTYFDDEHGTLGMWLRRWLIGSIARVMAGSQNRVLILDGPQGSGKSNFVQWLCSDLPEYYHEGSINPDDKDCRLRRMFVWIWEVNEFGNTARRADREALKAFLTTETIKERRPYGHYDTVGPAMASFIGTVNNEMGLLTDPTGNRRFMISHIQKINWNYRKDFDIQQIWAQAFELYLHGEPWDLTPDEVDAANIINDEYQMVDVVEETIKKYFLIDPCESTWWLSTLEILNTLKDRGNLKAGTEIDARRLSAALTKLGLERPKLKKQGGVAARGYAGINWKLIP